MLIVNEVIIIIIMVRDIVPLKLCGEYFQILASTKTFGYVGKSELLNSSLFVAAHVVLIPWVSASVEESTKCREWFTVWCDIHIFMYTSKYICLKIHVHTCMYVQDCIDIIII